jgi:hypothetical protein
MAWPKIIEIGGIKVPVDSWSELREAIQELSGQGFTVLPDEEGQTRKVEPIGHGSNLNHTDLTLLKQFIEAGERGLLTSQLAHALGKKGKGLRPALERWSRHIELVTQDNASAFEPVKRFDGRGFRMVDYYRQTAASMIGR